MNISEPFIRRPIATSLLTLAGNNALSFTGVSGSAYTSRIYTDSSDNLNFDVGIGAGKNFIVGGINSVPSIDINSSTTTITGAGDIVMTSQSAGSSLERGLALRDGGISAAKSDRFADAIRLFEKAHDAFSAAPSKEEQAHCP